MDIKPPKTSHNVSCCAVIFTGFILAICSGTIASVVIFCGMTMSSVLGISFIKLFFF